MQLRSWQQRAVDEVRDGYARGRRRQILLAPTGGGKTVIASWIIKAALEKQGECLFLAHRRELIRQAFDKLLRFGVQAGIIMAGEPELRWKGCQVASVQTLVRRPWRPRARFVIVDECHRATAATYEKILSWYPDSWVLGLTATPCRTDGRGLGDVFEGMVRGANVSELIAEGNLVPPVTYAPSIPDTTKLRLRGGDFDLKEAAELMNQRGLVGNLVESWKARAQGRRTVAFAVNVAHSQAIARAFREAGVPFEHLDGGTPTKRRDEILADLAKGKILGVSNCEVLTEGWDCPPVAVAIIARPTFSQSLWLQMAGRILRPFPGKDNAVILDHAGNTMLHGLVESDRAWDLGQKRKRRQKRSERLTPLRTCPRCYGIMPTRVKECSLCGWAFPEQELSVRMREGTLEEVKGDFAAIVKSAANRGVGRKAQALMELERECAQRGFKPGWVGYRFKERFGHWPTTEIKRVAGLPH